MKNNLIVFIIVIALGVGALFLFGNFSKEVVELNKESDDLKEKTTEGDNEQALKVLYELPVFELKDYNGNTVRGDDFQGKVLVVNSWASWCPFCVNELPDLVELQNEFGEDVQIVAINRRENIKTAKEFTDSLGVSNGMIYLLDPKDSFYNSIGGFSMPETVFVDKDGGVLIHKRGVMAISEIRSKILEIINNNK